jgi:hypothetical protein
VSEDRDLIGRLAELNPVPIERVTGEADSQGARDLLEEILSSPPVSRRPRRIAAWAAAAILAIAIAIAVVAVLRPTGQPEIANQTAPAVLRHVAMVAASEPGDTTGDVEYTKTSERSLITHVTDQGSYSVIATETNERWVAPDGSGLIRTTSAPDAFVSEADRAAWEAAGSPDLGRPGTKVHRFDPGELHYADMSALPTDPAALAEVIREHVRKEQIPEAPAMLEYIGELLSEPSASPELRAALYQVAAGLPGVELQPNAQDDAGRSGTSVSIEYDQGGVRQEQTLVFEADTSRLLERLQVYLEAGNLHVVPPFTADAETFIDQHMTLFVP